MEESQEDPSGGFSMRTRKSKPKNAESSSESNDKVAGQSGRWTPQEHELFLEGLKLFGRDWKQVAEHVKTRTSVQIRSHAQKHFAKLSKERHEGIPLESRLSQCIETTLNSLKQMRADKLAEQGRTDLDGANQETSLFGTDGDLTSKELVALQVLCARNDDHNTRKRFNEHAQQIAKRQRMVRDYPGVSTYPQVFLPGYP